MDANVFANAYETARKSTINFLTSRGIPLDTAVECTQAAWVTGWERLVQLRDDSFLVSWINVIALNYSRKAMRKATCHVEWKSHREAGEEMNLSAIDVAQILQSCSPRDRAVLEGQLIGRSAQELAAEAGMTESAMRIRCMRARRAARLRCETRSFVPA
ncbi:MAG: polymerase sigma factor [Bryobacterales bacterium]|jgi:DNA-directed RNA polymerase specialized sigma24 family protein|nr:polymerase sigma factor [Bryobacterales bacterium]